MSERNVIGNPTRFLPRDTPSIISFYSNKEERKLIGRFVVEGDCLAFEGNAEKSAESFANFLANYWEEVIKKERAKEREECAMIAEESNQNGLMIANQIRARVGL